jgi:hypothetical protein
VAIVFSLENEKSPGGLSEASSPIRLVVAPEKSILADPAADRFRRPATRASGPERAPGTAGLRFSARRGGTQPVPQGVSVRLDPAGTEVSCPLIRAERGGTPRERGSRVGCRGAWDGARLRSSPEQLLLVGSLVSLGERAAEEDTGPVRRRLCRAGAAQIDEERARAAPDEAEE